MAGRCRACGREWEERRAPGASEDCLGCGTALHACAQCRFYVPADRDFCREPAARDERPRDPERANRCSWFAWRGDDAPPGDAAPGADRSRQARAALEALFGPAPDEADPEI